MWKGKVQKLVNEDGVPKGMKIVLGLNTDGMIVQQMRRMLESYPDFKFQKCKLENII